MIQALHIFRKDVRRFRYELAVTAALTAAFAWSHVAAGAHWQPDVSRPVMLAYLTSVLLTLDWWFLISQLVQEESLAGDRQFWITRPYRWRHLLVAKLLFVLAFVNLPLFVAQLTILAAAGYQPWAGIGSLLWMQLAVAVILLAPAFALATITRSLAHFSISILCLIAASYVTLAVLQSGGIDVSGAAWPSQTTAALAAFAGGALMVFWQYTHRRTKTSIVAGLGTLSVTCFLYVGLPTVAQDAIRSAGFYHPEEPAISISPAPGMTPSYGQSSTPGFVDIVLPVIVHKVPEGLVAWPRTTNVTIAEPSGPRWSSGKARTWTSPFQPAAGPATQSFSHVTVPREFYAQIQGTPVTMHVAVDLNLGTRITKLLPGRRTPIPGGGFCEVTVVRNDDVVFCSSPFRRPYDSSGFTGVDFDRGPSGMERHGTEELFSSWESPWPDFGLSPVFIDQSRSQVGSVISFVRVYPRASVKRDFTAAVQMPAMR